MMRRPIDLNLWLERLLYWLLLVWYSGVVYGLVVLVVTWPARPISRLDQIPWWPSVIALGLVLLTYRPVSRYLGSGVHHLVYGQHDDAYAIVARVSDQLDGDAAPQALLPTLAATLAETLRLPFVAISAAPTEPHHSANAPQLSSVYGVAPAGAEIVTIPLRHSNQELGMLSVSARRSRDRLSAEDHRLLGVLARHVSMTLHGVRLGEALQASREHLVLAREEERRRIRRDLHDGLGPTLAGLRLHLGALRRSVHRSPAAAEQLIDELQTNLQTATADIRRIVYELRPPMLDEFGLLGALRNLSAPDAALSIVLEIPETLPHLPAAVEVALYRIAAEGLHNIARHAQATCCTLALCIEDEQLTLAIIDDGRGLPAGYFPGVGHQGMHERAAELGGSVTIASAPGGGTRITAIFPRKVNR
jgi:signal transduction histidine kinase